MTTLSRPTFREVLGMPGLEHLERPRGNKPHFQLRPPAFPALTAAPRHQGLSSVVVLGQLEQGPGRVVKDEHEVAHTVLSTASSLG
jgi:hypothetical protein